VSAFAQDQAEGLRRLLRSDCLRVIAVASGRPRVGKTTVVLNLASVLACRGKKVLVVDERPRRAQLERVLRSPPRYDLAEVIRGRKSLEEVIVDGPAGIRLLPAQDGLRHLADMPPHGQESLAAAFKQLAQSVDFVLVDPAPGVAPTALSLSLAAQEVLLLVTPDPQSITDTYALVKLLARDFARRKFHVIVNKTRTGIDAEAIYNNMAQAAGRYLNARLEYLGHVPFEDQVRQATKLGQAVLEAFPACPAGTAMRALVDRIDQWPYPSDESGRLDAFLNKLVITSRLMAEGIHL
jgi:flagellar biosynthesis protein FlhG